MNVYEEIGYGISCFICGVLIGVYAPKSYAGGTEYCMDKHGSAYAAEHCDSRDITPEYMYMDKQTQALTMILNQRSVQAEEGIAMAGATRINSSSYNNNSQGQDQSQTSQNRLDSTNTSNSRSRSGSSANSASSSNAEANANANAANNNLNNTGTIITFP